jgi:hypothetical protein
MLPKLLKHSGNYTYHLLHYTSGPQNVLMCPYQTLKTVVTIRTTYFYTPHLAHKMYCVPINLKIKHTNGLYNCYEGTAELCVCYVKGLPNPWGRVLPQELAVLTSINSPHLMQLEGSPPFTILILSSHLLLRHLRGLRPFPPPTKTLPLPIRATCPAYFIVFHFTTLLTSGER